MYQATLIVDADAGVLAEREDYHAANELAQRAWQQWRDSGSSSAAFETLDMDLVDDYIRSQRVDPYFPDFLDFISERDILFGVTTQRLGRIVETLLRREGLEGIPVFANQMEVEPFTIRLRFPYYNVLGCDLCPSCNLYHLRRFRRPGVPLVFVGDKVQDYCTCLEADLIFARNGLARKLRNEGVEHQPFLHLRDVERSLMRHMMNGDLERLPRKEMDLLSPPPIGEGGKQDGQATRS
ncbi:MAG: hypothetical protein QGG33_00320 [Candidatus Krumholzibacteria bacterium]|nr:hypothetical protein [Candidatus Krumholzibacteria bacterium]